METLRTLPGDDVRQIMWRYSERFDLQMAVQSSRQIARGVVARLVADGARNSHDWTPEKAQLLEAFDAAGLTALFLDAEHGGFIEGPKNLAMALVAYELAWVDGGAATCSLANNLALAPIHEKGTPEQREFFMKNCVPPQPGEDRDILRGAFALTEPLPYVGVDTGVLVGKIRVAEWEEGQEPMLQVDKRGRFITNMGFANYVTAAVDTADERIKSSCMVILMKDDPGTWDEGSPTLKMVHQLSSTNDPVLNLKVPASRIIGGYSIEDGKIVPNFSHGDVIGAVFHRTRITVGLMTSAKLISAVEPIIRYHRSRFRGGDASSPGTPRHDLGVQQKEDAVHRLVDVWGAGESGCSFGFEAARLADVFDLVEKRKEEIMEEQGLNSARKQFAAVKKRTPDALEYIEMLGKDEADRDAARFAELEADEIVQYMFLEAQAGILNPGCKLWNTGWGCQMMREAVALMGGYGITEDCPGFLGHKWMDAQLEATYEGPEAVQRRHLSVTMTSEVFLAIYELWIKQLKDLAKANPGSGACVLAAAMEMWLWTLKYLQTTKDANGKKLYHGKRQGVTFPMADALCWVLAPRYFYLDVLELKDKGPMNPVLAEGMEGLAQFYADMAHVQAARAAGEVSRICSELVYGYMADCGCKGGCDGLDEFSKLRQAVDSCLAGSRLAKDRAAHALTQVMIPEALDYPL
ncbi:MAG: acyl-CoA dehydrogenase [Desulfovibrio sp.]|nr:MAG: acyl-CoA dehydrogenase [Desulfovibrio sp.]